MAKAAMKKAIPVKERIAAREKEQKDATAKDAQKDADANDKKPRKFWIDGKFRELKKGEIRPYTAPTLLPEPEPVPSEIISILSISSGQPKP